MSRNAPQAKRPPNRRHPLSTLVRGLGLIAGGMGLSGGLLAAPGPWDCQAGPAGDWQCNEDGVPEVRPPSANAPVVTPLREPAPPQTPVPDSAGGVEAAPPAVPTAQTAVPAAATQGSTQADAPAPEASVPETSPAKTPGAEKSPAPETRVSPPPPDASQNTAGAGAKATAAPSAAPPAAADKYVVDNSVAPAPPKTTEQGQPADAADTEPAAAPQEAAANKAGKAQPEQAPAQTTEQAPEPAAAVNDVSAGSSRSLEMLDEGLPWQACAPATAAVIAPAAAKGALPIEVSADSVEASDIDQQALFSGKVVVTQGSQQLYADQVSYQQDTGDFQATGDALLKRPDLRVAASEIHYNLQTGQGNAVQADYRLPGILARGTAEKAELVDAANSNYSQISYTTCRPGNNDWQLSAERLELDTAEGLGTATDAKLSFGGVPLMYLPTLTFPIDDRRRSGLLIPSFGYGDRHGLDLSVPYYFNLAPNYDLTVTPRVMSKRGVLLGGDFRFLTPSQNGEIRASYIHNDRLGGPAGEARRGSLSLQARTRFTDNLNSSLNINYVSDDKFLEDFGSDVSVYSASHLERTAILNYWAPTWSASAVAQQFQTIDPAIAVANRPYSTLPRLIFSTNNRIDLALPVDYSLGAEFANFQKSDGVVEGRRLDLYPRLQTPIRDAWYHLTPSAGVRYTRYDLTNQTPGLDSSPDRLAPILSLDTGLYFDRDMHWFGRAATQSLEPRIYYLYVPDKKQSDIPVFDTYRYALNFNNLFRDNRFTSADRLGDANQVSLALTSAVMDLDSGRELLRASLGQIVYFSDRRVQLAGGPPETAQTSPLIAELSASLGREWRARGDIVWDPDSNVVDQALARASYRADQDHIFSASYRLGNTGLADTDLATIWRLGSQTRAIARWNYSLSEQRNLDALAGIEYGKCCWKLRALLRQQVTGTKGAQNLSFLVQLELRGLGKLGDDIDALLNDGIYGYRREYD